jgi:predicted transport protein
VPWKCPDCGRSFGRQGQPHSCVPSVDLGEWLSKRGPEVREILDAVRTCVDELGADVLYEPTEAAVMIKRARTFAEVKPRRDRTELALIVSRRIDDPRIARTLDLTRTRIVHVVEMAGEDDVDDQVRGWLREAYQQSPP